MNRFAQENDHPGYPFSGKSPVGSFNRGGTFKPLGESPLRSDSPQLKWPAKHLSGIPRDAMETTFDAGRPGEVCCFAGQTTSCFHAFAGPLRLQIVRIQTCEIRPMCETNLNKPATPLHDAQLGGYFFAHAVREGGGA